ncbi:uncharacterized protein J3R85_001672 [Psidium guajava]|nr:uncharacterized protein J3R85_001672 [Psidium guajava]
MDSSIIKLLEEDEEERTLRFFMYTTNNLKEEIEENEGFYGGWGERLLVAETGESHSRSFLLVSSL